MRIFYENLADSSDVTLSVSSQADTLPVENIVNDHKGKVWKTGNTVDTEYVIFDLGSAQAVTSFIAFNTTVGDDSINGVNQTANDWNIKIQGNASDSWTSPSFSQDLTQYVYGIQYAVFTQQTYQYWRFVFTKGLNGVSQSAATREVGRVFLGTYYTPTQLPDFDGYQATRNDLSATQYARGGQSYSQNLDSFRTWKLKFTDVPADQANTFDSIFETVGTHKPIFTQIDSSATPFDEILYVKMTDSFSRKVGTYGTQYYWDTELSLREEL